MKPHIEEALLSLRLADRDIKAFEVLSKDPEVHHTVACFHAQQAVEKSLKAVLFAYEIGLDALMISLS
jgi:HEPN domain-containing protein